MNPPLRCRVCCHRWPDSHMDARRRWSQPVERRWRRCNDCVECLPRDGSGATVREAVPADA